MKRKATLCAHAGEHAAPLPASVRPHAAPIFQTSSFEYDSHLQAEAAARGEHYLYTRDSNPTDDRLASALAELEGAEDTCIFATGTAAMSAAFLAWLEPGSHLVTTDGLYGGTHVFVTEQLARYGVRHTMVPLARPEAIEAAIRPETRLVHVESLTNPLLRVADIDGVAAVCQARGLPLMVDATFATPLLQRPLARGATLSMHSATKYIGGHGDLLLGVLSGKKADIARVKRMRKLYGGSADPFAAWLALRGLKTMALRVERQVASALTIARALEGVAGVERVFYPSLPSHPDHALAARALEGGGGAMVSFEVAGGLDGARRLYDRVQLIARAASLGDVTSLLTHPATFSHLGVPPAERQKAGISDGLLRLSVGIEDPADLIDDLVAALAPRSV